MYYLSLVEDLSLCSLEARLPRTLLQHAEEQDGNIIVPRRPWTTFDEISRRLGTVRDVLGRVLRSLEQDGILHVERQGIIILKTDELEARFFYLLVLPVTSRHQTVLLRVGLVQDFSCRNVKVMPAGRG